MEPGGRSGEKQAMAQETQKRYAARQILTVSFGTSYNDSREAAIGAIERDMAKAFPDYAVRRAFTSRVILEKLRKRDGIRIDSVKEALDRAAADGVTELAVQPTHLMSGYEYMELVKELENNRDRFSRMTVGDPLLTAEEDYWAVISAITADTVKYADKSTAVCFMGHGTEAASNVVYARLQEKITVAGFTNYYIGTVEVEPTVYDLLEKVSHTGAYKKVVLIPLMVVAGDHADHDMAGKEKTSWKAVFEGAGYEVECLIRGLGENEAIRQIYVSHARAAVDRLEKGKNLL